MELRVGASIAGGKYKLIQLLGKGAMGQVWQAWQQSHEGFNKLVVLKFQLSEAGSETKKSRKKQEEARRMFLNEARLAARLHHPNIVEIYDLGREGSFDFIAMEFIPGKDLETFLDRYDDVHGTPMPWSLAALIMMQVCQGLHHAHTLTDEQGQPLGLIHRDLKPANILVSHDGQVKIIDFGIAKASTNMGQTKTGVIKGTPYYMSPEQLGSPKDIDARADLYALGCILYELCTYTLPFDKPDLHSLFFSIMSDSPTPPQERFSELPASMNALIMRMLSKDPVFRCQTADELRQELKKLFQLEGEFPDADLIKETFSTAFAGESLLLNPKAPEELSDALGETDVLSESLPTGSLDLSGVRSHSASFSAVPGSRQTHLTIGALVLLLGVALAWGLLWLRNKPSTKVAARSLPAVAKGAKVGKVGKVALRPPTTPKKQAEPSSTPDAGADMTPPSVLRRPAPRVRAPLVPRRRRRSRRRMVRRAPLRRVSGDAVPKRRPTQPCREEGFGWVKIDVLPLCRVRIKSRVYKGGWWKLPAGRHSVRCQKGRLSTSFPIEVTSCQRQPIKRVFQRVRLQIIVKPPAKDVLVRGLGPIEQSLWHPKPLLEGDYTAFVYKEGGAKKRFGLRLRGRHKGQKVRCVLWWDTGIARCKGL